MTDADILMFWGLGGVASFVFEFLDVCTMRLNGKYPPIIYFFKTYTPNEILQHLLLSWSSAFFFGMFALNGFLDYINKKNYTYQTIVKWLQKITLSKQDG